MSEKREMSELERSFYHLREDNERYLPGEAVGVRDEDIIARREQKTNQPDEVSLGKHLRKLAHFLSSVVHR